jgi:hypothetical protein
LTLRYRSGISLASCAPRCLFGLIWLAAHFLWIVTTTTIIMALERAL